MSVGLKNVLNKEKNWKKKTTAKSYDIHQYSKLEDVQKIYILSKKKIKAFIFDAKMASFTFLRVSDLKKCCLFGIIYRKLILNGS